MFTDHLVISTMVAWGELNRRSEALRRGTKCREEKETRDETLYHVNGAGSRTLTRSLRRSNLTPLCPVADHDQRVFYGDWE